MNRQELKFLSGGLNANQCVRNPGRDRKLGLEPPPHVYRHSIGSSIMIDYADGMPKSPVNFTATVACQDVLLEESTNLNTAAATAPAAKFATR